MATQEYELVDHLGGGSLQDSLAHCATSCDNGRRVATLTTKKETEITFINFWRKGAPAVITKPVNSIDNSSKFFHLNFLKSRKTLLHGNQQ